MSKVAIIGRKDVYLGFRGLGFEVVDASLPKQAERALRELAEKGTGIIFISEALAKEIMPQIGEFGKQPTPAVVLIPDNLGSLGWARERIRRLVERAVGIDILSRGER
jgi:V/A-type H+-transporting ATPase subunit F